VSIVLVVRNEAARIKARLLNLLETQTALQSLIVVCDGCTDATAAAAREIANPAVKIIELETPQGKPMGVNTGIQAADRTPRLRYVRERRR
jgi:glycosyltransferase involved in cell wall biosynthesis